MRKKERGLEREEATLSQSSPRRVLALTITSNYDDDHNNDFKATIGLMIKTTALHVHHAFYYISLTSTARLRHEIS